MGHMFMPRSFYVWKVRCVDFTFHIFCIFLFLAHLSHQLVRELYFLFVLWIFVDKVLEL